MSSDVSPLALIFINAINDQQIFSPSGITYLKPGNYKVNFTFILDTKHLNGDYQSEGFSTLEINVRKGYSYTIQPIINRYLESIIWEVQVEDNTTPPSMVVNIELHNTIKALVMIKPNYPVYAIDRGIEGYCKLSFDLKNVRYGSKPVNIKIEHCDHQDLFGEKSITSLKTWTYSSVEKLNAWTNESTKGMEVTFRFEPREDKKPLNKFYKIVRPFSE